MRATSSVLAGVCLLVGAPAAAAALGPGDGGAPGASLLSAPARGDAAVTRLGADLGVAAGRSGLTGARLAELLRADHTAWVDRQGRLFYADAAPEPSGAMSATSAAAALPYDQTFLLHSRPGATRVIYLDFDGYALHDTAWNASGTPALTVPPYSTDTDPAFSSAELDMVQEVWARVSEDYAPFDVDVTTQDPGTNGLARTSAADAAYGARVSVSADTSLRSTISGCGGGCAGVSYVGTFDAVMTGYPEYYQPAFALPTPTYSAASVAEIVSHEVGHNLGLSHDGQLLSPYYRDPDGTRIWSPIMGAGYTPLTQFSNGDYIGATQTQDDFAVIAQHGPSLVPDDYGGGTGTAYPLGTGATATGLIGSRTDLDVFRVAVSCAGTLTATLSPAAVGADLDSRLRLLDAGGVALAIDAPPAARPAAWSPVVTGLGATVSRSVEPGTYFVEVDGVGLDGSLGYSDYGSVGRYTLTVSGCVVPPPPAPPTASPSPAPTPTPTMPVTVTPTVQPVVSVPSAPVLGKVRAGRPGGRTTVRVAWRPPATTGGAPVTSYDVAIWRLDAQGRLRRQGSYLVASTARTLTLVLAAGRYCFAVSATNSVGDGPPSSRSVPVRAR